MSLIQLIVNRKTGNEAFHIADNKTELTVLNFWQWANSDLLSNTARGILAEFIVASALSVNDKLRNEWDAWDLTTKEGIKVEVKSAAYIQSWDQTKHSNISFNIAPTKAWNPNTNTWDTETKRQSDAYVFCLLHHKDQNTIDPLNLDQWSFYLISTKKLNEKIGTQKTIGLSSLLKLQPTECRFEEVKETIMSLSTQ